MLHILTEASERDFSIGKTQLVKFLYLTEVEYFRITRQRLTDLRWLFYHYGPYALELEDILAHPEFHKEQFTTQSERDFIRFRVAERVRGYKSSLDAKVTLIIKRIVGQWKDKPLPELLDYVYFETEPMQEVKKRGDVLDFSTIRPESETERVIPLKASKATERKVAELRGRMKPFLESIGEQRAKEPESSADYLAAISAWAEEEGISPFSA
ncbi:MAG: type II toxin-antitoxin system antitoxin SocA domain-containing protein [Bacteroidota bacterium]